MYCYNLLMLTNVLFCVHYSLAYFLLTESATCMLSLSNDDAVVCHSMKAQIDNKNFPNNFHAFIEDRMLKVIFLCYCSTLPWDENALHNPPRVAVTALCHELVTLGSIFWIISGNPKPDCCIHLTSRGKKGMQAFVFYTLLSIYLFN